MFSFMKIKRINRVVTIVLLIMVSSLYAQTPGHSYAENASGVIGQQPNQQPMAVNHSGREIVPPPPPGPYVSSAMRDSSTITPAMYRNPAWQVLRQPAFGFPPPTMTMDRFSPDRAWPEDLSLERVSPSNQWQPERAYHYGNVFSPPRSYATPPGSGMPNHGVLNPNLSNYAADRTYAPEQNWPDYRWAPSMMNNPGMSRFPSPRPYGQGRYERNYYQQPYRGYP
ncbi:MAG: hypothetical protein COB77_04805 [Gammaproteobacteria bacterium]|nr:MAG: hypothetical protein COB77_04805 [Gammaproteobacteria bacterium]